MRRDFAAAGADQLQEECNRIGKCPVGESVITKGYAALALYHTYRRPGMAGRFTQ